LPEADFAERGRCRRRFVAKTDLATGNNIVVVVANFAESYHILCINILFVFPCIIMVAEVQLPFFVGNSNNNFGKRYKL